MVGARFFLPVREIRRFLFMHLGRVIYEIWTL